MNILESRKRGWVQRWRQDEGERERERSEPPSGRGIEFKL